MEVAILVPLLLNILKEGMGIWSQERKDKFKNKYYGILKSLSECQNRNGNDYNDTDVDLKKEDLYNFLKAYNEEQKDANKIDLNLSTK